MADDDDDVRALARRYLERSKRFTVVAEAVNGAEAVVAASAEQPDVTLLDLLMPDTDGLTALPRIRAAAPATTVVVVSALHQSDLKEDALAAGAAGFLAKQASWSQFVIDLLTLLDAADAPATSLEGRQRQKRLPNALTSGHDAREFLRETLGEWDAAHLLDDAELLTSELVNNAVLHATSAVRLTVVLDQERLRVEVSDTGAGALHLRHVEMTSDGGRGLFLVDALSRSWGTSAGTAGKTVWFEIDAKPSCEGPPPPQ